MWRRSARWSLFSFLLLVNIIFSTSTALVDSEKSDFSNTSGGKTEIPNLIQVNHSHPSRNQIDHIIFQRQTNPPNTTNSLKADPFNRYYLKKRWSRAYDRPRTERRSFFPTLAAPRPHPNNGLPFKGYRPNKPPQVGYPVARPPLHIYQPQPNRPTQPSHTYGVPKPTGYPASSNHHQQEIYITYPPATTVRYPQTTISGSYGPAATPSYLTTSASPGTSTGYHPPKPTVPVSQGKPIYEVPISYPNPSYITNKPDYYLPSTTPIPYTTPRPPYPLPVNQGIYPGYPVSSSGSSGGSYNPQPASTYPSPLLVTTDSHKPNYPVPPISGYPSYPVSSGGSYHGAAPVGSPLPVFVFIPKPGYHSIQPNSKPGNYHKPSGSHQVNYYPTPRPSGVLQGQYYPVPVPVKPPKPTGVYPPAKAPSTAYGVPKPQRPTQQFPTSSYSGKAENGIYTLNYSNAFKATGYRNDHQFDIQPNNSDNNKDDLLTRQPLDSQPQENGYKLATSPTPQSVPLQSVKPAQPSVFQRGNVIQRPANSQATYSAVIQDFIALPDTDGTPLTSIGQPQFNINNRNKSWLIDAESSHLVTITELPNIIGNLPYYRDDFRLPFQSTNKRPIQNDCGGSWVVLGQSTAEFVDPTQVQVEPIYPTAEEFLSGGFDSNFNGQFIRGPKEADEPLATFPPRINELSIADPNPSNSYKSYVPDFLIFSTTPRTTPYTELSTTTSTAGRLWRKPNNFGTSSSFHPSPLIPADPIIASKQRTFSSGITVVIPESTDSVKTLTSTENSVIFSLSADNLHDDDNVDSGEIESGQGKLNNRSPFLAAVSPSFNDQNDDDIAETFVTSEATGNNVEINANTSVTEDTLIRNLRSANLRALSSLINQAEIASLFENKEYTLMAPSNAAFSKISASQRRRWITRPDSLREVLLNHVIPSHLNSSSFENEATHITLAGPHHLRINIYNATDIRDTVTTVNGARFLTRDLRIGKLLIHIVDRVLMPSRIPSQTILDILNDGGLHASLLGPALTKILSSDSPLSVFVPTTEAFLSVSQDEQRLFLNNETAFHNLLWYHIVPGTYYSEGLEDGQWLSTLHGVGRLRVDLTRQNRKSKLARINGEANVIESDVSASNGVVHFIDRILTDILF